MTCEEDDLPENERLIRYTVIKEIIIVQHSIQINMKHIQVLFVALVLLITTQLYAQQNSTFGKYYTPKGKLKVLVVFLSRDGEQDTIVNNWPNGTGDAKYTTLPTWKDDLFYTNFEAFDTLTLAADTAVKNLSNYFYQMSGGELQIIAEYFPERFVVGGVNLAIKKYKEGNSILIDAVIDSLNNRIQQMGAGLSFNFPSFDNRGYALNDFNADNSSSYVGDSIVDKNIDFTLFVLRTENTNGYQSYGTYPKFKDQNDTSFSIINTLVSGSGSGGNTNIIRHEMAHATDNMPHSNTVDNSALGQHLYNDYTWGEMNGDNVFYTANGWERWRRGWMDTVYYADNTQDSVEVTLGDFITKGEALKIRIPGTKTFKYLSHICHPEVGGIC